MPDTAKQEGVVRLLQMDVTPFKEIRAILTQQNRSIESAQNVSIKVETREVPSEDGEWENHEPTGRQFIHVVFDQLVFVNDKDGIRLAE